ncbi:homoserine O-acetyltransferase|uniref:Homoserine O-acetyltransferase n=1 Tax=Dendrosporobacter quercicolus TaxID=146817 RepID=A0A1G9ZA73_9FIRM|nr:homoserine O-acetyltransferase [Dendrosporobacter quercicolus]NSL49002.1 homoserine O-acetyltransferase [Dendrosporobacter quercicolus DSM 1736]SDN17333.1 homoserine O-acetyltransferase [Dendrosporobacter quercicolus]
MTGNLPCFQGFKWRRQLRMIQVAGEQHPLVLAHGGRLTDVTVAYETYGKLTAKRDNVILVAHALTGDSHVAAHDEADEPGWWEALVGPGRPLDTGRFYIICANVLGGCQGTTGPASINPQTGRPYGGAFPQITIRDMVRVQKRLLHCLGIHHLVLVVGGSMGGMQALEWAVTYPEFMDGIAAIAAPGYSSAQAIAYSNVARQAIMLDSAWRGGDYYGTEGPRQGMALARALGMITYQSEPSMAAKFGRKARNDRYEVESYLEYQGDKLFQRFDANSLLCLQRALDLYDLGAGYASYAAALARIEARVLAVGVNSDILYPSYQQAELAHSLRKVGVRSAYAEIDSPHGHDGFLLDFHLLRPVLQHFIDTIAPTRQPWSSPFFRPSRLAYFGACLAVDR